MSLPATHTDLGICLHTWVAVPYGVLASLVLGARMLGKSCVITKTQSTLHAKLSPGIPPRLGIKPAYDQIACQVVGT